MATYLRVPPGIDLDLEDPTAVAAYCRSFQAACSVVPAAPQPTPAETVAALRPIAERLRRGEWRVLVTGPRTSTERDLAAMFQARVLDLLDSFASPGSPR